MGSFENKNHVTSDQDDVISITIKGPQNRETVQALGKEMRNLTASFRANSKAVRVFTDISELKLNEVSSGARQEARSITEGIKIERSAVYGKGVWMTFIMYLVKVTGQSKRIRFFTNKRKATTWLTEQPRRKKTKPRSSLALGAGILIGLIGVAALVGWAIDNPYLVRWIPGLRPINPVSAAGLVALGVGLLCYWAGKLSWLRITGVLGILLGILALSPLTIDYLLFSDKVLAAGAHNQIADSAAICFIAIGITALLAGRKGWWVVPLEYVTIGTIALLSVVNVFGQLYSYEWLYGISGSFVMAYNLAIAFVVAAFALVILLLYRQLGVNVLTRITWTGWLIVVVLLLVQAATYGSWSQAVSQTRTEANVRFKAESDAIKNILEERFTAYTNALYGFQGLFLASTDVNQGEFKTYYNSTNVATQYPGLRTISFISKVESKNLAAFIQKQRTDKSTNPLGNPTFEVRERTTGPSHYIVTYTTNTTTSTGLDLGSDPLRLATFLQAEATKRPVASGTVRLPATSVSKPQDGFFITVPVAFQDNPNQVIGFVNAVFNYSNFFNDTFTAANLNDLDVQISEEGKDTIFASKNARGVKKELVSNEKVKVANRTWQIHTTAPKEFGVTQNDLPGAVLFAGQTFSFLLIIIFWIQARGRQRALKLADDITEDLQEERNRAVANDQKSKAILSSIGDAVFAVDMNKRIQVFNKAAQEISGYTEAEALGKPYDQVLKFEFEKNGKQNDLFIKKALSGHMASMASHTLITRLDGKQLPVADSAAPIRDANGKQIGAIVVFRDVSKEYELDKAKSEFVSLASHQLRTPLSAINWYGEMLLNGDAGKLNKDQLDYIREIFEGSQRMVELVNSLLNVSRLEVGKLADKPAPIQLEEVVESLEKELEVSVKSKKMTLIKHIDALPVVVADPKQLRMIIQNLMSNAVKYTPEKGTVTVTLRQATAHEIETAKLKPSRTHWYFSVQDTGYGIPQDQHSKIFGKLFRADNVRKLDVEGTGLGLYIVKQVVEKMGGKVWFESMESIGTTFYVIAPIEPKHRTK